MSGLMTTKSKTTSGRCEPRPASCAPLPHLHAQMHRHARTHSTHARTPRMHDTCITKVCVGPQQAGLVASIGSSATQGSAGFISASFGCSLVCMTTHWPVIAQGMGQGLEDILAAAAEDESESPDDSDFKDDPVTRCDLAAELAAQLRAFSIKDPAAFQHCASYLSGIQRAAVQRALSNT